MQEMMEEAVSILLACAVFTEKSIKLHELRLSEMLQFSRNFSHLPHCVRFELLCSALSLTQKRSCQSERAQTATCEIVASSGQVNRLLFLLSASRTRPALADWPTPAKNHNPILVCRADQGAKAAN